MSKAAYFQQGDVVLVPVERIPAEFVEAETNVLQEGEVTGHAHRLHGDGFRVHAIPGKVGNADKKYLRLVKPVALRHEEHKEIKLPTGDFEIRIVREYDHFEEEARRVAD